MQQKTKVHRITIRKPRKASRERLIAVTSNIQKRTEDIPLREILKATSEAVKAARGKTGRGRT